MLVLTCQYIYLIYFIFLCVFKKQELLMFLSKAPAFMPADYSFIYLSLFILQSIHLCRYSTYSGFLHIPLPGLSDILATSIPLHFVVFITILSAGTFVSLLIYVPIPNATFALPLKYLYSLSALSKSRLSLNNRVLFLASIPRLS